jgi:hypothetical protein
MVDTIKASKDGDCTDRRKHEIYHKSNGRW